MKNELHPWEVGLAEQVKGKEFSFDPQAFADFESLLEAETLGQEPGYKAPHAADEIMSTGGGATVSLPLILLAIGLACLAGWWYLPGETEELTEPEVSTSAPTTSFVPSTEMAPAAPPTSTVRTGNNGLGTARELPSRSSNLISTLAEQTATFETPEEVTNLADATEELAAHSPRIIKAINSLTTLPIEAVTPHETKTRPLPTVQKPTPNTLKRDRKALFPDVIKKN